MEDLFRYCKDKKVLLETLDKYINLNIKNERCMNIAMIAFIYCEHIDVLLKILKKNLIFIYKILMVILFQC
ncbi:MAG: hypothetical protein CMF62_03750 [Magnetococcales bacterium]|nr:hypothetical protein [Magnetococcales bacterium]